MASVTASSSLKLTPVSCSLRANSSKASSVNSISLPINGNFFPTLKMQQRSLQICSAAKPETVEEVCKIVKEQLALEPNVAVTGASKFSELGADSLDTVEVVMKLEETFGITVEEESASSIASVQDAADLIEELVSKK
ncbi:hypothetical protein ACFE04_005861 [Oxalis oulophora]